MKMADTEPLQSDEYIVITDPWRMDWEKGVQVPVHPDEMPYPNVRWESRYQLLQFRLLDLVCFIFNLLYYSL